MKQKYEHIFFDFDHTLWDFDKNSFETLSELYQKYTLGAILGVDAVHFISTFHKVNRYLWDKINTGEIDQSELRQRRFREVFKQLGVEEYLDVDQFNDEYINICPTKANLIPFAEELLAYLSSDYRIHLITNGFPEIQDIKLKHSNIDQYFDHVITTRESGVKKPHKEMYAYAVKAVSGEDNTCLMVGDDLIADVIGAKNYGIDQVYFNPTNKKHKEDITFEVTCLSELKTIL